MTSTIKNPSETDAQSKPGESPRSNPVCLEVNVTLRSLPTEANGLTQPIREDLKTVIVFDNGAVLRSANNLPAGTTLILSNASARDVVCRVVTGRSMPAVKGYAEVEFMEPVKDFWGIHQEGMPGSPSTPAAAPPAFKAPAPPAPVRPAQPTAMPSAVSPSSPQEPTARPVMPPLRPVPAIEPPSRPAGTALAGTPEFDEFPAPMGSMSSHAAKLRSEPKSAPPPSATPTTNARTATEKPVMEYSHSEVASSSVANWTAPEPEPPAAKVEFRSPQEPTDALSSTPAPTRDFMSKGLMAYEQPGSSAGASAGRTPLLLGAAALVLAGVSGVVFFMHRGGGPAPVASAAVANPTAASHPATPSSAAPAAVQSAHESAPPAPTAPSEPQPQAQAIAAQPVQPSVAVAPIPSAEIANASAPESRADSRSARRQDNSAATAKQVEVAAPKRPMISNLKMSAPSAPSKNIGDSGDGAAPVAEIASADLPAASTSATLLSSSGRTAGQPAAPPTPAPPPPPVKAVTEPKLISSTRPAYPMTARQSNIQGSVTVVIYIDQTGKVFSARALSGPVMLRAAAEEAVKQWKYSPALEDGKPAQAHVIVKVDFKIN